MPADRRVQLDRVALGRALGLSASAVDRLRAGGLLRPTGHRGRVALYTRAAGQEALQRAEKVQTPYGRALVELMAALADEARARLAELHAEYVHRREWVRPWRELIAAVRQVLDRWSHEAPPRLTALLAGIPAPRALGSAIQRDELRPLLTSLAAIRPTTPYPRPPASPAPGPAPSSLAAARRALLEARSAVSRMRAALKRDRREWRTRAGLDRQIAECLATARAALWQSLPAKLVILAGSQPGEATVRRECAAIAADVVTTLETLERPGGARKEHRP